MVKVVTARSQSGFDSFEYALAPRKVGLGVSTPLSQNGLKGILNGHVKGDAP